MKNTRRCLCCQQAVPVSGHPPPVLPTPVSTCPSHISPPRQDGGGCPRMPHTALGSRLYHHRPMSESRSLEHPRGETGTWRLSSRQGVPRRAASRGEGGAGNPAGHGGKLSGRSRKPQHPWGCRIKEEVWLDPRGRGHQGEAGRPPRGHWRNDRDVGSILDQRKPESLQRGPGLHGLENPPVTPLGKQAGEPRLKASGQNRHFSGGIDPRLKNILFSRTLFCSLFTEK